MDLNSRYQELQQNQRLLRFRSATSSSSYQEFMDINPFNNTSSSGATSSMLLGSSIDQPTSSSAGHFSNNIISFQNGYDTMKGVENYDGVNESDGELTLSMSILKNQIGFSTRSPSSLGKLSQNSKMRIDGIGTTSRDDRRHGDGNDNAHYYGHKFVYDSNDQSSEMFVVENSSAPSSIRAKRGCATHPRSVAERVRRTRISEGLKKLQELVPNIDKQTCTSEMLELAVEYIKDLQKQLKIMSAKKAKCRCKNQK